MWILIIIGALLAVSILDRFNGRFRSKTCLVHKKEKVPEPRQGTKMYYIGLNEGDGIVRTYDASHALYKDVEVGDKVTVTYIEGYLLKTRYSMKIEKCQKEGKED